jgi:hypothetical protein
MLINRSSSAGSSAYRGAIATLLIGLASAACGAGQSQSQAPTAQSTDEVVTYKVPKVVTAPGSAPETQSQKGVIVQVVPMPFTVKDTPTKDCVPGAEQSSDMFGSLIKVGDGKAQKKPFIVTSRTGMDFQPKTLTFQVKITNNTDKVMKLNTAMFKLNIADHEVMLSDAALTNIKNTQLFPNSSKSFEIAGPDWGQNPEEALVTFYAYQVPSEIDNLGAATDGANFTWTFAAKLESRETRTKKIVENLMLDPAEATALKCHPGAAQ